MHYHEHLVVLLLVIMCKICITFYYCVVSSFAFLNVLLHIVRFYLIFSTLIIVSYLQIMEVVLELFFISVCCSIVHLEKLFK